PRPALAPRGVHARYLPVRVSRPVRGVLAATGEPVIAGKPPLPVEHRRARQFPHVCRGPADHQDNPAAIAGGIADPAEFRFEALTRQMLHIPILAGTLPS